jgi:hypothetical protein
VKINNEKKEKKIKNTITIDYENKRLSVFYFLPLLLIAGFVPLIVFAKYVDLLDTTQALYWTGQKQYLDFFSYWKAQWVVALTVIALFFYIILYLQKKLPFKNLKQYYIPLGIYAIFVITSTIFAIDTQTALWGFVDMYQGMFVLLGYVLITFLTINFVNNERDVTLFVKAFLFLMIVEGTLGIGQYFGFDFLQTKLGNDLILPDKLVVENLSFSFGPKTIYGTLFNTNFVGSFATLMLPLSVAFLLGAKTTKQRIISVITTILMIFVWIGCNSRAGYLGIAVAAIFAVWLFRKIIRKYWIGFVGLSLVLVAVLVGLNHASDGLIISRIKSFNLGEAIENAKKIDERELQFKDIRLDKNNVSIVTDKSILNLKMDGDKLYFLDENFTELEITTRGNKITINDKSYNNYSFFIAENYPGIRVYEPWSGKSIDFYFSNNGVKILGSGGRLTEPMVAERFKPLDGLERFMSGRGYIWSRSIPMLKTYLIKGAGADNYAMVFPQDDFIAKIKVFSNTNIVVDKPHNMYLQIAINTGVISLISLLTVWGIYIISSLKLYRRIRFNSLDNFIGASCFVSVIGYLIAGIFNDHVLSVAPLFWIILGIGISINARLHENMKKEAEA